MEILALITVNIIMYFHTIFNGLVMDDIQWYEKMKARNFGIKDVKSLYHLRVFIVDRLYGGTTFGTNPKVEHAVTIFLHTLICCLMYWAFGSNHVAYMAAILYAVNPINNQTSIWLNGRRYAVNIIIVLLMIILSNSFGIHGQALALLLCLATPIFHMTAIFAPVLFGIGYIYLPFLLYLIFKKTIDAKINNRLGSIADGELKIFTPRRLIVIVKCYGFYFFKMLVPGKCFMMYPDLFNWGRTKEGNDDAYKINGSFYRGILLLLVTGYVCCIVDDAHRSWVVFMALAILQWCNVLPILQLLADRYVSVATVFMMYFLAYFLNQIFHMWDIGPLMLIYSYYCFQLKSLFPMYQDIGKFYNYHMDAHPGMPWPRVIVIGSLLEAGKLDDAAIMTRNGLLANPNEYALLIYGSILALLRGNPHNSELFLDNAEKNMNIGQEEVQRDEIKHLRTQVDTLKRAYLK